MNDSPVGCQSRRTDRSIFSAEKMQDRWFKSFSRNQTNPQEWLNTAVFGDFSFKKSRPKPGNSDFDPCLTHTGIFTEQQRGRFGLRCWLSYSIFLFFNETEKQKNYLTHVLGSSKPTEARRIRRASAAETLPSKSTSQARKAGEPSS